MEKRKSASAKAAPARDRILEAARRMFYRDGIRATGIDAIIAEAGIAKMSFYNNFPSKDDLVRAFLAQRHEYWMEMFHAGVERHRLNEGFVAIAYALGDWFDEPDFRGCAFINTVSEFGLQFPIALDHKVQLETWLIGFANELELTAPQNVARQAMVIVEGAIVRAQMGFRDGLTEATADLLRMVEKNARGR